MRVNKEKWIFWLAFNFPCATLGHITKRGKYGENMKKLAKTEMIRARCGYQLKSDVQKVAEFKNLDEADIVRLACSDFVQRFKAQPFDERERHVNAA